VTKAGQRPLVVATSVGTASFCGEPSLPTATYDLSHQRPATLVPARRDFWQARIPRFVNSLFAMTYRIQNDDGVTVLAESECWDLLAGVTLGRLVTSVDGRPEIFPVNFAVQRRTILFRTAEGTKLVSTAINNQVVFEVDDHNVAEGWSVIVKGTARSLRTGEELENAERAQVLSWTAPENKTHYVRVSPQTVTGRRFQFGSTPMAQSVHI
jgi:nitroimidazol reductase NimA-like FMN-containing flavoprotein (pyridoxamine 5'-phosphate oxidase superfamily)